MSKVSFLFFGFPRLERLGVGRLVAQDEVGEAGVVEPVDQLLGEKAAVGIELDRNPLLSLGVANDVDEPRMDRGLTHLVELHRIERTEPVLLPRHLVEDLASVLEGHHAPLPLHDLVGAERAVEVAQVGDLDEEPPDRVHPLRRFPDRGKRRRLRECLEVRRKLRRHSDSGDLKVLADLHAEARAHVLEPSGIEVLEDEERPLPPGLGRAHSVPALFRLLIEAAVGGFGIRRGVLKAKRRELGAEIVDLDDRPRSELSPQLLAEPEVEVLRPRLRGHGLPPPTLDDLVAAIPFVHEAQRAVGARLPRKLENHLRRSTFSQNPIEKRRHGFSSWCSWFKKGEAEIRGDEEMNEEGLSRKASPYLLLLSPYPPSYTIQAYTI
jgi:hypothetical protein